MIDILINLYVTLVFRMLSGLTLVFTLPVVHVRELYMKMTMSESDFVCWNDNFLGKIRDSIIGKEGVV